MHAFHSGPGSYPTFGYKLLSRTNPNASQGSMCCQFISKDVWRDYNLLFNRTGGCEISDKPKTSANGEKDNNDFHFVITVILYNFPPPPIFNEAGHC